MKEKNREHKKSLLKEINLNIKHHKNTFITYLILRALVIAVAVRSLIYGNYEHFLLCVFSLLLFMLPALVSESFKIELPSTLEIIVLLFIFSAEILGELSSFYVLYPHWDTMLHTMNGFLCAAIGFSLFDVLNRSSKIKFDLSPFFLVVVAFCFSMTVGVLWEFFEFGMDVLLKTDMQKDIIVNTISSVSLDPSNANKAVIISNITDTVLKTGGGTEYSLSRYGLGGYLDIGLIDTMEDLFVNFIGATVFSVIGFFYIKSRGKGKFARSFIPVLMEDSEKEQIVNSEKVIK